jgi:hypothetical protein
MGRLLTAPLETHTAIPHDVSCAHRLFFFANALIYIRQSQKSSPKSVKKAVRKRESKRPVKKLETGVFWW